MWNTSYYKGREIGWGWAGMYAVGTKAERAEIRRKLGRMAESDNHLVQGIWDGFGDRAEQISEAIRGGRVRRTVNPFKLERVLQRAG